MSLSTRILIGFAIGVFAGLFFGEKIAPIGLIGEGFILLLQMTVLPYVAVSLITGLGDISSRQAIELARSGGIFLLAFWGIALLAVAMSSLAFPHWESASYFSTNLIEARADFNFLRLFIPANPFQSLAESVVPAVVVFSLAIGVALLTMEHENKRALLDAFRALTEAFSKITMAVVQLAPYGILAIAAEASGTMGVEEIEGLRVYLLVYIVLALILTFWALPGLVAALTPFRYRDVVWYTRDALTTAFATGNVFVVLTVIVEKSKQLVEERLSAESNAAEAVDVVVPVAYTFPSAGKLLALCFLPFAGWMSGYAIPVSQLPALLASGLATFFGSSLVAVPFLLDMFQIPADLFQLFVVADNVLGSRFGSMLAAVHLLGLSLLASCAMAGRIRVRPLVLLRYAGVLAFLLVGGLLGVRVLFETMDREYKGYTQFVEMSLLGERVDTSEIREIPESLPIEDLSVSGVDRIESRGLIRIGYSKDALPYAFRNTADEVVGFDIDMANRLASDFGANLELVVFESDPAPLLDAGYLDLVMTGWPLTTEALQRMAVSTPYLDETLGFVVEDHRRNEFSSREAAKAHEKLRLAVPARFPYYSEKVRAYLPQAELVELESARSFFQGTAGEIDALAFPVERGSAWCLVYPQFSVTVPKPDILKVPLVYLMRRGDFELVEFVNNWIALKKRDGTIDEFFEHWILGRTASAKTNRWSIGSNVLGLW